MRGQAPTATGIQKHPSRKTSLVDPGREWKRNASGNPPLPAPNRTVAKLSTLTHRMRGVSFISSKTILSRLLGTRREIS